jgi:DNA polymerase-3 subunit gamma/tau
MAYKVLSLKWRPQTFEDVVGQEHVTQTLINAFKQDRIAQGYIFTGPRGVGKTTTARILAMAMNAESGPTSEFDPKSEISQEISNGRSMDVVEIDGASNRGIEEIRNLREQIKFSPMHCTYKVIIIDEVHMLTNQAFNALLRTLEEPPKHGKFIFATTDIHKVPATIISRCQRFDFNRISIDVIRNRISHIMKSESIDCDAESIYLIAKKADGSMRDALSILDQSISYCGEKITYDQLVNALGIIDQELYFKFTKSIRNKDYQSMIMVLSEFSKYGVPASEVLIGIQEHIRNLIYFGIHEENTPIEMNSTQAKLYKQEAVKWDRRDLFRLNQVIIDTSTVIRKSDDPYLLLEMAALKLLEMDKSIFIDQLLSDKNFMENKNIPDNQVEVSKRFKEVSTNQVDEDLAKNKSNTGTEDIDKKPKPNSKKGVERTHSIKGSFDDIKGKWEEVLGSINRIRPSVGSIIEDFVPISIVDDLLVLESKTGQGFNEKVLERGIPIIEKELENIFDIKIRVKFKTVDIEKSKSKSNTGNNPKTSQEDDKVFDKIVDLFDGEIIH